MQIVALTNTERQRIIDNATKKSKPQDKPSPTTKETRGLNELWDGAEQLGNYDVSADYDAKYIYPTNPQTGKTIRITLVRHFLYLRHKSSTSIMPCIVFKRHKHQGRWMWNDSRYKKGVQRAHIAHELGRLLFNGDTEAGSKYIATHME